MGEPGWDRAMDPLIKSHVLLPGFRLRNRHVTQVSENQQYAQAMPKNERI